jgi:predicted RNase H-like HicB family nuclease
VDESATPLGIQVKRKLDYTRYMRNEFTAVIERDGEWFVGWSPEIPGANGQGRCVDECRESLGAAIQLIMEDRRSQDSASSSIISAKNSKRIGHEAQRSWPKKRIEVKATAGPSTPLRSAQDDNYIVNNYK